MSNPYLKPGRLAVVIASITALGTYKFYKLDIESWAERISGDAEKDAEFKAVFTEHPEFFRFNKTGDRVSLVWRRQRPKRFHVDKGVMVDNPEGSPYLPDDRLSRQPLEPSELTALVDVAVNLHARAVEQNVASKWWVPILAGILAFMGSIGGALISKLIF